MKYEIKKYPDNTQYVQVNEFSENLIFKINSYQDLWTLRQIKDICDHNRQEVNLTIPCLLDAQADRRFNNNESTGLKLVCEFINSMNFKSVSVFHPHNAEVVEALINRVVIIDNLDFVKKVFNDIKTETFTQDTILFSSDAGGFKPLIKLADKLQWRGEIYGASKSRSFDGEKSNLIQVIDRSDFKGKDIVIIDDICVYGGTFKGLSKMLKERNCGNLFLVVSHMTIQELGNDPVTNYFDKVFTTNSKYNEFCSDGNYSIRVEVINLF